jgi:hypothetical protein
MDFEERLPSMTMLDNMGIKTDEGTGGFDDSNQENMMATQDYG